MPAPARRVISSGGTRSVDTASRRPLRVPPSIPTRRRAVVGLHVPAHADMPVALVAVELSAVALSEFIGGGLLDEAWCGQVGRAGFTMYLDDDRVAKDLPGNERAAVLSARLGNVRRAWLAGLRGHVLVLGRDTRLDDTDVPSGVVCAARQAGILADLPSTG